jgi:hypothetical protein
MSTTNPDPGANRRSAGAGSILAACLLLGSTVLGGPAAAQEAVPLSWSAQLRSTAYFYQVEDLTETETDLLPFYEHLDLSVGRLARGRLDLRFSGRFASDLGDEGAVTGEEKFYVGYAAIRLDPWQTSARIGRQFLQEGTNRHTLDGVWVAMRPARLWRVHAWAGGEAPAQRDFELSEFGDEAVFGARAVGNVHRRTRVGAWFATRKSHGETAATPVGGEIMWTPSRVLRAHLRGNYETENSELERFDLLTQIAPRPQWPVLTLQFIDRKPMVHAGSYFARFNEAIERVQVLRTALRYEGRSGIGAEFESFSSWIDERNTNRIGLALIVPHARVGWSTKSGDAGKDLRFYGDVNYHFGHWLQLSGGATFSEYSLLGEEQENDEDAERELVTLFGRARVRLTEGVRFMAEAQSLENPFYSEDVRLLLGLDLAMGRGASNFGWGAGGAR